MEKKLIKTKLQASRFQILGRFVLEVYRFYFNTQILIVMMYIGNKHKYKSIHVTKMYYIPEPETVNTAMK